MHETPQEEDTDIASVVASVGANTTAISAEAAARTSADATLTTSLNGEIARAVAADSTLTTNLSAEIARATAAEALKVPLSDTTLARNRGVWAPATAYAIGDQVKITAAVANGYPAGLWRSLTAHTSGTSFTGTGAGNWLQLAGDLDSLTFAGTFAAPVADVSALRAIGGVSAGAVRTVIAVGDYVYNTASTVLDDGRVFIKPTSVSGAGRWVRADEPARVLSRRGVSPGLRKLFRVGEPAIAPSNCGSPASERRLRRST